GVCCVTGYASVRDRLRHDHRSGEDAARRERYTFLRKVAREHDATRIVTGHTLDDQAETVLMRLLRGAGANGLAGMRPLSQDIARPLLETRRAETAAYCAARGWEPREDATNQDRRYLRNRMRLDVIPALEAISPGVQLTLARTAGMLAADEAYLNELAMGAWEACASLVSADTVALRRNALEVLAPALAHRIYRRAWESLASGGKELSATHILALAALLAGGKSGGSLALPGGVAGTLDYDTLTLRRVSADLPAATQVGTAALPIPGIIELAGWRVSAEVLDGPAGLDRSPVRMTSSVRAGTPAGLGTMPLRAYVDADRVGEALHVRTWLAGDRFRPLGMRHEKKVQDYLSDAKVPRALRGTIPLVVGSGHIIWVAGQRIDDRVRITPETKRILLLEMQPLPKTAERGGE
ncbi:MAG TPA: tRNA lysidine(34) synthetase TilS, partial [Ktedonobacterales bacterium]